MRLLDSLIDSKDMNLSKLWETVEDRGIWQQQEHNAWNLGRKQNQTCPVEEGGDPQ